MTPEEHRLEFWLMFRDALEDVGGSHMPRDIMRYRNMAFSEVVEILAQNGMRMICTTPPCTSTDSESKSAT